MESFFSYLKIFVAILSLQKWIAIFDTDGKITLEEYCDVLGLEVEQVIGNRQQKVKEFPSDVINISFDMENKLMLQIIDIVREGLRIENEAVSATLLICWRAFALRMTLTWLAVTFLDRIWLSTSNNNATLDSTGSGIASLSKETTGHTSVTSPATAITSKLANTFLFYLERLDTKWRSPLGNWHIQDCFVHT